jgi:CRISPR-associated exonuclease Cas4
MESSLSNLKNLSLTQALFKSRFNKKHEKKDANTIYVTDLLYCPLKPKMREQFREISLADVYNPAALQGSLIHESVEGILAKELNAQIEVEASKEVKLEDNVYKVVGRADAVIGDTIIEIKTSKGDANIPVKGHVQQLRIYMNLLNVFHGVLLYVTPDRVTEFHVDDKITDAELKELVTGFLTAMNTPREKWECKYCVFSKLCPHKVNSNEGKDTS